MRQIITLASKIVIDFLKPPEFELEERPVPTAPPCPHFMRAMDECHGPRTRTFDPMQ